MINQILPTLLKVPKEIQYKLAKHVLFPKAKPTFFLTHLTYSWFKKEEKKPKTTKQNKTPLLND